LSVSNMLKCTESAHVTVQNTKYEVSIIQLNAERSIHKENYTLLK
jgi:hypothetical protein